MNNNSLEQEKNSSLETVHLYLYIYFYFFYFLFFLHELIFFCQNVERTEQNVWSPTLFKIPSFQITLCKLTVFAESRLTCSREPKFLNRANGGLMSEQQLPPSGQ